MWREGKMKDIETKQYYKTGKQTVCSLNDNAKPSQNKQQHLTTLWHHNSPCP